MVRTLGELFARLKAPRYIGCSPLTEVTGLCVDSRRVEPDVAFLALRGETVDAHHLVPSVLRAGAAVAIVDVVDPELAVGPLVVVDDTAAAYPELAANANARPADRLTLAGITGTNGKTTTAHLLASIFGTAGLAHARLGTTGNWIVDHEADATFTTPFPLELQTLLAETTAHRGTHVVMEVSSHALQQGRVRPLLYNAVGFTSFSQDHLDFHPSMEAYLTAKCLLASDHLSPGGFAVAAVDQQPASQRFLDVARNAGGHAWRASRGADLGAEILATQIEYGRRFTSARLDTPRGSTLLRTPLIAPYNLDNVLVAAGIAVALDVELDVVAEALRTATGAPGRLERVAAGRDAGPAIFVDYAHTPDAVARALLAVRSICEGRLHVVLGCGGDRDATKRAPMGAAAAAGADVFWATSDNPRTEDAGMIVDQMLAGVETGAKAEVHREIDRAIAITEAVGAAADDDVVLIAGKGHEDYQILGTTKVPFDDRVHATAALRERAPATR